MGAVAGQPLVPVSEGTTTARLRIVHLLDTPGRGGIHTVIEALQQSQAAAGQHSVLCTGPGVGALRWYRADVILLHAASRWQRLPWLVCLRLLNPRARLILHEHHYSADAERRAPSRVRLHTLLRASYRLVDAVVAVSRAQGDWLRERRLLPDNRLHVIPPCRDLASFRRVPLPDFGRPLVLGAYGRLHRQKGFDLLIDALRRLPAGSVRLLIGGSGPEEVALRRRAADLPCVEFTGALDEVPDFLARCDIVVVPSRYEPYGLVCLEARAAGRPVVVSAVDGLPEQLADCGLAVPPGDSVALAGALASLPEQPLRFWAINARISTLGAWTRYQVAWQSLLLNKARENLIKSSFRAELS
jgi:glycosyltransferase involved in cell wall biosynthesis